MTSVPTHMVDASAIIAYLKGEPGQDVLAALLRDDRNTLWVHAVNICEVYYNYLRSDGATKADEALDAMTSVLGILPLAEIQFMKRVSRWKVTHNLGICDAIAAAAAEEYGCPLVTTDHGDFDPVQAAGALQIVWLR